MSETTTRKCSVCGHPVHLHTVERYGHEPMVAVYKGTRVEHVEYSGGEVEHVEITPEPTPILDAMKANKMTAAEKRARFVDQLNDLCTTGHYVAAIAMMTECRNYGRSRGWLGACGWFEDAGSHLLKGEGQWMRLHEVFDTGNGHEHVRWVAVQSLIWFAREM